MGYRSNIKMSVGWIYPIGILTSYIIAIIEWAVRDYLQKKGYEFSQVPYFTFLLVGLLFIALGIIQWFRYRNWIYPVLGVLMGILTFQASFAMTGHFETLKITYFLNFFIIVLFIVVNWSSFYGQERFEINSRRLFRLAAERLYETSDGFSERPYAAGKTEFTKDELLGFVRFLHGSYIIRPFYFENYVAMTFSMNTSLLVIKEYSGVSHIILNHTGYITVKISEKDYNDYKERLSFDQLCSSVADVFTRFLDYYKNGLEARIITELKSAK
jgi:hypothetical protein